MRSWISFRRETTQTKIELGTDFLVSKDNLKVEFQPGSPHPWVGVHASACRAQEESQSASMFVCGDDAEARSTVMKLAEELGFEAVDCGPLFAAR